MQRYSILDVTFTVAGQCVQAGQYTQANELIRLQVCRGMRPLAQRLLSDIASDPAYALPPCPVTCFPYVWGMNERWAQDTASALGPAVKGQS